MLSELIEQQQKYVNAFFESLDRAKTEEIFHKLAKTSGTLFFSGVGKSGIVAQKIASTLVSTGTKALYMSPLDALHGDIGIVSPGDHFLLLSKSGESDELLRLIDALKLKRAQTVAVVCNPGSRLAKIADDVIHLPLERELCPFDLSPTTSAAIQLLFGDILAVALMRKKAFSIDQYAINHPAGLIGKRAQLMVKDIMLKGREMPLAYPEQKLIDLLVELSNKRCGCLIVVDAKNSLQGIFTDGDLRRALQNFGPDALQKTLAELATKTPRTISPEKLAYEALKEMERDPKKPITVMPVVEADQVVGVIKLHDILQEV